MKSIPFGRIRRRTALALAALIALLALGAQTTSAGQPSGSGGGNGNGNGKALGKVKHAAATLSAPGSGGSTDAAAGGDEFVVTVTPEDVTVLDRKSVV